MSVLTIVLASLAAFEHFYIFYLESLATHSASTSRVFNMDQEELHRPSVTALFKNQGIYNALIGVFLLYGLFVARNSEIVTIYIGEDGKEEVANDLAQNLMAKYEDVEVEIHQGNQPVYPYLFSVE